MPIVMTLVVMLVMLLEGCQDLNATLPAGTSNPSVYNNPSGALQKRNAADSAFQSAFLQYVIDAGLIADELESNGIGAGSTTGTLDERILPQFISDPQEDLRGSQSYNELQQVRGATSEAIGALAKYDTVHSPALRGEMYALQGYAEVMLAELFCSGVPLSTYDFEGDFTYRSASTQQQVYQDALVKFDSAIALSSDSARILNLARVGLSRTYLDLGDYPRAAAAVAAVPNDYQYQIAVQFSGFSGNNSDNKVIPANILGGYTTVADDEGTNGLPFISSGDPRTRDTTMYMTTDGIQMYFPQKYAAGLHAPYYSHIALASSVEARLIQAEAALNANDPSWLTILNALRTSGPTAPDTLIDTLGVTQCRNGCGGFGPGGSDPVLGQPAGGFPGYTAVLTETFPNAHTFHASNGENVQDYCNDFSWYEPCYGGDTMVVLTLVKPPSIPWRTGIGGVVGLAPLTDPGASLSGTAAMTARVDLLFQERAYWLYVTGHRQGDLRRLVRQYHRDQSTVYPVGPYLTPGHGRYGNDVTAPIPSTETPNPYFHGCLDRDA